MIHDAINRLGGFALSIILHLIGLAALVVPLLVPTAPAPGADKAPVSVFVARAGGHAVPPGPIPCGVKPCGRKGPGGADPFSEAPQLDFLDDVGHELLAALRRAGGAVAVVSQANRWRALALYRVSDGVNVGAGLDIHAYPLRLIVHDPAAYPQIVDWISKLDVAEQPLRIVALFPADAQAKLYAAVEAESTRRRLSNGRLRATVAVSASSSFGIEIRSVELLPRDSGPTG
jgi:hypothetical protein